MPRFLFLTIFTNPHFRAVNVFSKLVTNGACIVWAIVIVLSQDALSRTSYRWIANYVHEDLLAASVMLLSIAQVVGLLMRLAPRRFGNFGYGVMMTWWLFVWYSVLIYEPTPPTALAGVSAIVACAVFACISWPRNVTAD